MSPFGLILVSGAFLIALIFFTRRFFYETKKEEVILGTGLVLFIIIGFFSFYAENNMRFSYIKKEYPIEKVVHYEQSIWNDEFYRITYQDDLWADFPEVGETIGIKTVTDVFESEQEEKFAICVYEFLFFKEKRYVYFRNVDEKNRE